MNHDKIRMFLLGKSPRTSCHAGPTGVIVKSRYYKNILGCIGIVAIISILALTTNAASFFTTTFGMLLLAIPILLSLTIRKYLVFRKNEPRLVIVKLIGTFKKSEEYSYDDIESIRVETYEKPSVTVKKISLQMKNKAVIPLDETADVDYAESLVTSICQVSGITRT